MTTHCFIFLMSALSIILSSCASAPQRSRLEPKYIVEPSEEILLSNSAEIENKYRPLSIISFDQIPKEKYDEYAKYISNKTAYVIVHPSYFLFFHNYNGNKLIIERKPGDFSKNIVDMFVEDYEPLNPVEAKMKEMERRERDFIRKAAARNKLLILVLPNNYLKHSEYPYRKLDEFARYLNEVTGGSPSVIYVESEFSKRGFVERSILPTLNTFFENIDAKNLLIGGGYVDLCLHDFYIQALNMKGLHKIEIVPEISTVSPDFVPGGQLRN